MAEPGPLLHLLLGLDAAESVLVDGVLVHVALVALLLTQPEIVPCSRKRGIGNNNNESTGTGSRSSCIPSPRPAGNSSLK